VSASFIVSVSGLVIATNAPLNGLRPVDVPATPDVRVTMRGSSGAPSPDEIGNAWYVSPYRDDRGVPLLTICSGKTGYFLCYAEGTRFRVTASGTEVEAWWDDPLTEVDAADYLLGGVIAFISRLRGAVPMHASAVVIDDHAILFAGAAGAGKSSIAAAFAVLGYPVLSDDVVVVDDSSGCVVAHPSRARLSVWPDSAGCLFSTKSLPAHSPVYDKRRLDLVEHGYPFHDRAVPVGLICVLSNREPSSNGPTIRALLPRAALMALVTNTYGNYLLDTPMRAREFDVLARVAESVGVSALRLRAGLDELVGDCRWLASRLALESASQAT
jgi:hypothetical protein